MNIRYHVELSEAERCELTALTVGLAGKHYARKIKQAQMPTTRPTAGSAISKILPLLWLSAAFAAVYRTKAPLR